jgi:hypothetical protein
MRHLCMCSPANRITSSSVSARLKSTTCLGIYIQTAELFVLFFCAS